MKDFIIFFIMILLVDISRSAFGSGNIDGWDDTYGRSSPDAISDRFLSEVRSKDASCKNYPFICRLRGSSGPDCCKNSCVDVFADQRNCGRCGKKCKHGERCCGGECVNLNFSTSHCGRCFNKCGSGDSCSYGLCAYA
ncbi:unnamed protein product [Victoria cruziana]